jgi:hypothetical protein
MANLIEIEDDLFMETSADEIRFTESPSPVWHSLMFMSSIPLAASIVLLFTSQNFYYLIMVALFIVIVAVNQSRKITILDLSQETVQISFICWKYHVYTRKLISFSNKKFKVTYYKELADDEQLHYVLELDSRKLLIFQTKDSFQKFFGAVGHRIKIEQ